MNVVVALALIQPTQANLVLDTITENNALYCRLRFLFLDAVRVWNTRRLSMTDL